MLGRTADEMLCRATWEAVWGQRTHGERDEIDAPALARWLGFAQEEEKKKKKKKSDRENSGGIQGLNIKEWKCANLAQ